MLYVLAFVAGGISMLLGLARIARRQRLGPVRSNVQKLKMAETIITRTHSQ